jgi:hypothetical protein
MCDRTIEQHAAVRVADTAVLVDDMLINAGDTGYKLDRGTGLETVLNGPVLIYYGQDLARLGLHNDDRSGFVAECVDRGGTHLQIFTFSIIFLNV